ncbi:MAG TPA: ABC transporter permease [Firmicutes bacterium]|nr:ABC transporter permease [Bacillota bacterium]
MDLIWDGMVQAAKLLLSLDPEVLRICSLTLRVSGLATLISVLVGVPLGLFLALTSFRGRGVIVGAVNTGMGLPPVVVGLWVSILLWRYGPLGFLGIMYTPAAMVIAQSVIALPLVTGFTMAGIQQLNPKLRLQLMGLGASRMQVLGVLLWEARLSVLAAVIAGFGGVISEVGASNMVGGNILGQTRVLTTATMMEVSKGNFGLATALGLILLAISYTITQVLTIIQQRGSRRD